MLRTDSYDILLLLVDFLQIDLFREVSNHLELFIESTRIASFGNSCEGVAHDCNEHVHEYNEKEEGSQQEEDPSHYAVWTFYEVVILEFTKGHEVHANDSVDVMVSDIVVQIVDSFDSIFIYNEEEVGESEQNDDDQAWEYF